MEQRIILFFSFCIVFLKGILAQDDIGNSLYSRRYEKLDIDTILNNPRLVTNYVECLLNRKPCPPEGKALKRILPEALRTKCSRCWPSQKEGALKVITKLYYDYPVQYDSLRARWDPTGEYHRRFEEYLRDTKFNVINSNGGDDNNRDERRTVIPPIPSTTTTTTTTTTLPPPTPSVEFNPRPDTDTNQVGLADPSFIGNRFGEDVVEFDDPATRAQPPRTPAPTPRPVVRSTPRAVVMTTYQTQNPILNIINRLSLKFSNTAGLLAGMFRGAVQVATLVPTYVPDPILWSLWDLTGDGFMKYDYRRWQKSL